MNFKTFVVTAKILACTFYPDIIYFAVVTVVQLSWVLKMYLLSNFWKKKHFFSQNIIIVLGTGSKILVCLIDKAKSKTTPKTRRKTIFLKTSQTKKIKRMIQNAHTSLIWKEILLFSSISLTRELNRIFNNKTFSLRFKARFNE